MEPRDLPPGFNEVRADFPVLRHLAYLNAGSKGPISRTTFEAIATAERNELEYGRDAPTAWEQVIVLREDARAAIAMLIGADPTKVALTDSTSSGCNMVVAGLGLEPTDEIVTTDCEHPGLLISLRASGAKIRVAEIRDRAVDDLVGVVASQIGPHTKLIALSHVTWTTGQHLPIHEIKRQTDIPILVDGAQAAGAIPVEVSEIDFYALPGYKWLCGPDSVGALYIADPDIINVATPSYFSYDEVAPNAPWTLRQDSRRFDSGWLSVPSLVGMTTSVRSRPHWCFSGPASTVEYAREAILEAGLELRTTAGQSALVVFGCSEDDPMVSVHKAYAAGVVIRDVPGTPWLRASIGYWTTSQDIDRLLRALTE
jgi:L-cysteine/cystine lyase